jgi:YbbR domain-containing protein
MQIVRKNFALKLLAVGLAIVGWAYFRFASNPIGAASQFDQQLSIPISAVNLPLGYVARFSDHEAVVTITTKRGQPAIKPEEIKAVLDLADKESGVYNVPVQLVAPDLVVQSLSPASVTLTIEKIEERQFPVNLHYVGAQSNGIVLGDANVRPARATARGATSFLARVAAVHADVALPSVPKAIDEMIRPIAVDSSGAEIAGVSVVPDMVRVQVQFVAGTGPSK